MKNETHLIFLQKWSQAEDRIESLQSQLAGHAKELEGARQMIRTLLDIREASEDQVTALRGALEGLKEKVISNAGPRGYANSQQADMPVIDAGDIEDWIDDALASSPTPAPETPRIDKYTSSDAGVAWRANGPEPPASETEETIKICSCAQWFSEHTFIKPGSMCLQCQIALSHSKRCNRCTPTNEPPETVTCSSCLTRADADGPDDPRTPLCSHQGCFRVSHYPPGFDEEDDEPTEICNECKPPKTDAQTIEEWAKRPETKAAIRAGVEDIKAGRVQSWKDVKEELGLGETGTVCPCRTDKPCTPCYLATKDYNPVKENQCIFNCRTPGCGGTGLIQQKEG